MPPSSEFSELSNRDRDHHKGLKNRPDAGNEAFITVFIS